MIRRQLPAASPLSPAKLSLAALDALGSPEAAREALRANLAERFGAERVVLTGSGTQALQLALVHTASGQQASGAPVAMPAYACYDLITAAVGADVRVLFYDIDPVSLTPDPDSLERALRAGARTIVAASLYGFPLDWDRLRRTCDVTGAALIEDSAQGLGSGWAGKEGGSFGDLTVLSFGRGKGWTGGSGGALLIRDRPGRRAFEDGRGGSDALRRTPPSAGVKALATSLAQWALGRPSLYRLLGLVPGLALGETHYKPPTPPARMSAFAASAALRHAGLALQAARSRRETVASWHALRDDAGTLPAGVVPCRPLAAGACGWLRCPVLAPDGASAERVAREGADHGVARGYPKALPDLREAGAVLAGTEEAFPGARRLAGALLTLPTHDAVTRADVLGVQRAFSRARSS